MARESPKPALEISSHGAACATLDCDKELLAILAETEPHYYPLRKRSEKNIHPYTKLVWTNPTDLHASSGMSCDFSVLEEPSVSASRVNSSAHDSQLLNPEDSEDGEYIPGSVDLAANDTQGANLETDTLSQLPLHEHRQG
ncbi:hypothetical protein EV174_004779, partial [Coemansia sp. RSA 2320]